MAIKRQKCKFGRLLESYRQREGYRHQTDLQRLLKMRGYDITVATINRYEFGERQIPIDFVYAVVQALELSEEEGSALVDALVADYSVELLKQLTALKIGRKQGET